MPWTVHKSITSVRWNLIRQRGAACAGRHLALSTNSIDKIAGLGGLDALQILSLGRNLIRKIEGLEPVAETLEQLWLSYNQLERLVSTHVSAGM